MGIFPKTYESCLMIPLLQKLQPSSCLLTQMTKEHLLTSCGDSILDKNEECDCGSELLCHLTKASRCCDFKTCKFRSRSYQCATGQCCKNCRFRYNHACKAANGECDKARYCTGRSAHVLFNINIQCDKKSIAKDYETCNSEKGFCLEGKCLNMHTLCRQAYNSSSVYYSPTCARYLKTLMQTTCPRPTHLQTLNNLICVKNPNICNHFVCGMGPSSYVPNIFYFDVRSQRCIIPNTIVRVGLLGSAPNYMYCGVDRDGTNNYCWKGNCKNGINGKKCRLGECNTYMVYISYVKYSHFLRKE
ncbi:hypothetical protein HZS_7820 [Henneguya salminicola]|nr:hypothetical protein HZS_7820 [Henneguya salminicola]